MRRFYVYIYFEGDIPRYIGKGTGQRYKDHLKNSTNKILKSKIEKGVSFNVEIIKDNLTEEEAYKLETELISEYGRIITEDGPLFNFTLGGEGVSGYIYNDEEIIKRYKNRNDFKLENIKTGEIKHFISLGDAARYIKTSTSAIFSLIHQKTKVLNKEWKLPGNDTSKYNDRKKKISIKDIKNKKIYKFDSLTSCAKQLQVDVTVVSLLLKHKILHISRRYILPSTPIDKLNNIQSVGKHHRSKTTRQKYNKPFNILNTHTGLIETYESRKHFTNKHKTSPGDISSLLSGKINSLQKGKWKRAD